MAVPAFLLRKLYRKGSLRQTGPGRFAFTLQNPLATATVVGPPLVLVNGVRYRGSDIGAGGMDLGSLSEKAPWVFEKGAHLDLHFKGNLMRGGNRITLDVPTREFGELEVFLEDREADFCAIGEGEEE